MAYFIIISVFLSYFILHSIVASITMKQWMATHYPAIMPWYRLIFNALAILLSFPLLAVMLFFPGEPLWAWHGIAFYLSNILALMALIAFFYSLKYYDLAEFWGTRQLKEKNQTVEDQENFHISPFHRYVRHPWYFFSLVIIWTRDVSTIQLLVYSLVTAYFIIGSKLEERKLVSYHGEIYKKYQQKVAGVIPLPWKILSTKEADQLLADYSKPL